MDLGIVEQADVSLVCSGRSRLSKANYLDGIRHIEAAALCVPDVQPGVTAAVVQQVP